jgi:uncharacterized protein (DUF1015 family)
MRLIKAFPAIRPRQDLAAKVAAPPYDVLNRSEAQELAAGNEYSFLHINKPEIDMPASVGDYDPSVYAKGRENLDRFLEQGILAQDDRPGLYLYRQIMGSHQQTGIVAVASVEAYEQGLIKKHEFTRPVKEDDRVAHMDALDAQVGPVFLTYPARSDIDGLVAELTADEPCNDFTAADGVRHVFWTIDDAQATARLEGLVNGLDALYVADGHHRSAAACRVKAMRAAENPDHGGEEPYNYFLVVLFPHDQMQILDYNRVFADLGEHDAESFLRALQSSFEVTVCDSAEQARPEAPQQFALFLAGRWQRLALRSGVLSEEFLADPVKGLDVSIMQELILTPLLAITDQRTDKRIDFVGGIRGLGELEKRVNSGEWAAALALYPTSIESLMAVADAGEVMPPKSTWFEPKLRSGLAVHSLRNRD